MLNKSKRDEDRYGLRTAIRPFEEQRKELERVENELGALQRLESSTEADLRAARANVDEAANRLGEAELNAELGRSNEVDAREREHNAALDVVSRLERKRQALAKQKSELEARVSAARVALTEAAQSVKVAVLRAVEAEHIADMQATAARIRQRMAYLSGVGAGYRGLSETHLYARVQVAVDRFVMSDRGVPDAISDAELGVMAGQIKRVLHAARFNQLDQGPAAREDSGVEAA